jgi:glycosyltransferase involved in cell wall biosynthesis/GT2 family glycosyltransferase
LNLCLACRDVHVGVAGGLAHATRDLACALASEGHSVQLLTDLSPAAVPELDGVSVRRLLVPPASEPFDDAAPETAAHDLLHAAAVYREVRRIHEHERPVDAVLAPLWRSEGAVCLLDREFPTIVSCMTSMRTLVEVDPRYVGAPGVDERLALEAQALARARYLHGLTESVLVKTVTDYDLHPAATAVISRGLTDLRIQVPVATACERPLRVLFVGRLEHRKGVDVLLAAAQELIEERADVTFTLVGPDTDPSIRCTFDELVASSPRLRDAVQFAGAVSDGELASFYTQADLVCAPSRYESHGIVLIEAMMFGKPVVTCDAGGIGEVVEPGREGLVVPPDDPRELARCLRLLIAEPALRAELGRAGRRTYERRFRASTVARQMQAFIERAAAAEAAALPTPDDVAHRLERLLREAFGLESTLAASLSLELIDPRASGPLHRIRAAANASPPPRQLDGDLARRVTAVLVTHDRPERLSEALASLDLGRAPIEVVVIDNGSSRSASAQVTAICSAWRGVRRHRLERNLGAAGGRRLGVELARTELVLFLDDDAELMPGALAHLIAQLDANPDADAVAATVVAPDGSVLHSGGSLEMDPERANFALIGVGVPLGGDSVPASGPAAWLPNTAILIRRALLAEFELDEAMSAYYEDNEWCYRIALERPRAFRRCREALAIHHLTRKQLGQKSPEGRALTVKMLTAHARFYERHGVLLSPWLFDVVPELRSEDGSCDLRAARLLLELVSAKGAGWTVSAWIDGSLAPLLDGPSQRLQLRRASDGLQGAWLDGAQWKAEVQRLREAVASQEQTLAFLHQRHETLAAIEQGGWWQLRGRLLPLLRLSEGLRAPGRGEGTRARR